MKDVTMLLNAAKIIRFLGIDTELYGEFQMYDLLRTTTQNDGKNNWEVITSHADWYGFMDDEGDFIPVDWC